MEDVGIVGAGPVGLTLACILQGSARTCAIYEKKTSTERVSKAFAIHARTLELFRQIGIDAEVVREGRAIRRMSLYSQKNKLGAIDFGNMEGEFPYFISIPQYRLEEILTARLRALGGEVLLGRAFTSLQESAGDAVTLVTVAQDGTSHERTHKYVVGTDGAHSAVRKHLGIAFEGDTYDSEFLVVDARVEWDGNGYEAHTFLSRQGYLMIMPFAGRKHRVVTDIPAGTYGAPPTLDQVHILLKEKGFGHIRLSEPEWISNTRYHRRLARQFRKGNVFLAGDACHIHSPIGGQGLNTGIQDAFNLGWKMAMALSGQAKPGLLDSYQHERRAIAAEVLQNTDAMTRRFATKNPIKVGMRDLLMPVMFASNKVQKKLVGNASGLSLHYAPPSDAGASASASTGLIRGGQRLPDLEVRVGGTPSFLHRNLPAQKYCLLHVDTHGLFAQRAYLNGLLDAYADRLALVELCGGDGPGTLTASPAQLARLTQSGDCVILVRPDGYLAQVSEAGQSLALDKVLANLFAA